MVIYSAEGVPIIHIKVDDSSYKYEEIMGDCNVYLEFALTEHVEIEPGAYILFQGVRYEMMTRENVAIQHNRNDEDKATFSGPQSRFGRYVMYNYQDGRLKFDMIGKPTDFLTMVLWNLNEREPNTWAAGDIVIKEERLVSFSHTNVRDALNAIAEAFDTEWSVTGGGGQYYINLRKNEFNKDNPLALGYGKNHGFKPGVGRFNYGAFGQVQKVWIDGGERNLSIGEYGWTTLHFPAGLTFSMDAAGKFSYTVNGQSYQQEAFDSGTALEFVTDEYGASVRLADAASNCVEASLDLTEYYPKRVGKVTDVRYLYKGEYLTYQALVTAFQDINWNEVQVDIVDSTIGDEEGSLDYSECLFSNDEPLTVIFQNGMLAGREFNATFVKEAKTRVVVDEQTGDEETVEVRPANRFELVRTTIDGVDMPNAAFRPNAATGADSEDDYIVVNCYLPEEYIRDFAHFGGAELEALREACKFIRDNMDPQFTFKGTVDDLYSRRNWLNISGKLILGGCVSFQDSSIQPTPIVTRIVGIKNYVNNPYAPELTLSNETVKGGMSSMIAKLKAGDEHVMERVKEGRRFSMRSFRDAKETIAMLAGTIDYFSEGINPITVETMSLLVGYEALQFKFWTSRACTTPFPDPTHYDPDTHMFSVDACVIQHMTHGITDVMPSEARHYYDYMRWSMPHIEFGPLTGVDEQGNDNSSSAYYLYAKVDAANVAKADSEMTAEEAAHIYGEFVLSKTKKDIKAKLTPTDTEYKVVDGVNTEFSYYYLLVGILNSEYEGGRSFAPMYGFTEVLPGQITTDVIRSASGDSYFDLANNQFALGSKLTYINNILKLRGALVVTGAGEDEDLVPIGAWCGEYDATRTYAAGDEVWADVDGEVMTFRYVYATPSSGHYVTDTQYWIVAAKGKAGGTGPSGQSSFQSTMFVRMNSTPTKPAATDGSFSDPSPANILAGQNASGQNVYWEDGIPSGEEMLWATTRIFTSDGQSPQESSWHDPRQMTDTSAYDVEFAKKQTNDAVPEMPTDANRHGGSGTQIWFDPVLDSAQDFKQMYWRAEREKKNGVWTTWTIIRIKGEKGDDGSNGVGVSSVTIYYGYSMTDAMPTTWTEDTHGDDTDIPQIGPGAWIWIKEVTTYTDGTTKTKYSKSMSGGSAPVSPFRGEYGPSVDYYGCFDRTDIVKYNGQYYRANPLAQTYTSPNQSSPFHNIAPGNTAYWLPFIGNYDNLATGFAFIEQLVVQKLNTAGKGNNTSRRIVAEGNELLMFDGVDNVNPKMIVTGNNLSGFPQSFDFNFGSDQYALHEQIYNYSGSGYVEDKSAGVTFTVDDGAVLSVPSIGIDLNAGLDSYSGNEQGFVSFDIGWEIDGEYVTGYGPYQGYFGRVGSYQNKSFSEYIILSGFNLPLSAGQHTIKLVGEVVFDGCDDQTGHTFVCNASPRTTTAFTVGYAVQRTEIGANGFQVAFGSNNMFKCVISSGTTTLLMQSESAGIEVSSNGANTGTLRIRIGGTWYYAKRNGSGYLELSNTP